MSESARAVIFDLDGTLVNSLEDLADCTNRALAAFGLPTHPVAAYKYFLGNGVDHLFRAVVPEGTAPSRIEEIKAGYRADYARNWAKKSHPYPGILSMLGQLAAMGVPLAVLSNKSHGFTVEFAKHFFPDTPFAAVEGSPAGGTAKPDPAMALDLARRLGLEPESVAFMGDTRTDMETATNAGMLPVGVLWGFRPASELLAFGAKVLLERPDELFAHVCFAQDRFAPEGKPCTRRQV